MQNEFLVLVSKRWFFLNSSAWISVYLPMLILFFIIIPQQREREKGALVKIKKRKGLIAMTNEIIKNYIGKTCKITTGSFGVNVVGTIIDVNENWLEVETRKGRELINADFIQSIKIKHF
jgi:preprotein translocase subunit YajC